MIELLLKDGGSFFLIHDVQLKLKKFFNLLNSKIVNCKLLIVNSTHNSTLKKICCPLSVVR